MIPAITLLTPTLPTKPPPAAGDGAGFALTLAGLGAVEVAAAPPQELAAPGNALPTGRPDLLETDPLAWLPEPPAAVVPSDDAAGALVTPSDELPASRDPLSTRPAPPLGDTRALRPTPVAAPTHGRSASSIGGEAEPSDAGTGRKTIASDDPLSPAPMRTPAPPRSALTATDGAEASGDEPKPTGDGAAAMPPGPEPIIAPAPMAPPPPPVGPLASPTHERVGSQAIDPTAPAPTRTAAHRLAPIEFRPVHSAGPADTVPLQPKQPSATESVDQAEPMALLDAPQAATAPPLPAVGIAPPPASRATPLEPLAPMPAVERERVEVGPILRAQLGPKPTGFGPAQSTPTVASGLQPTPLVTREPAPATGAAPAPPVGSTITREPATPISAATATSAPAASATPTTAPASADAPDAPEPQVDASRRLPGVSVGAPPPRPAPTAVPLGRAISSGPASQVFAAALRRGARDERSAAAPDEAIPTLVPSTPTGAAVSTPAAAIDMRQERWPHVMVERIERLRDAADAADTRVRLVPDALGAVEVSVRREGEVVHVHFAAEQAATRALLQDAAPRLAEAAEARGLKLGQLGVSVGGGGGQADANGGRERQAPAPHAPLSPARARRDAPPADDTDTRIA